MSVASENSNKLQHLIDEADAGETLHIPEGVYEEHITITKPIHLIGEKNVSLTSDQDEPLITIQTDDVSIENMQIIDKNEDSEHSTIYIEGNNHHLTNLSIRTNSYGIKLHKSSHNTLSRLIITGNKNASFGQRKHGVDLRDSHENTIHLNTIQYVQDGVYVEKSNKNMISNNRVTDSRYGYHLMFTTSNELRENESYYNISGMMVMGTKGTKVIENTLKFNEKSVQALGLLLYDVMHAHVEGNIVTNNRIGIFIEDANHNEIFTNDISQNYIGIQFKRANDNTIFENRFNANVAQAQAEQSALNEIIHNYWGDHNGLDLVGDGESDIPYNVDPFYLILTDEIPPFQLLFQTPGMTFLEELLKTPNDDWLVDQAPLMNDPLSSDLNTKEHSNAVLFSSVFLLVISMITIYSGVKKQ